MSPLEPGLIRKRIYMLRHGEVSYFDADGRPVDPRGVSLTEDGIAQIEAVRAVLFGAKPGTREMFNLMKEVAKSHRTG